MSKSYLSQALTPANQREQADPRQVLNSAGGYTYAIDDWGRLERFLILGSEGGTYYATERKLTRENAQCVERCLKLDGPRTVAAIVAISDSGRAPKNDPAILSLAIAARKGDDATRRAAYAALPKVCRTGTHLYHFVAFADQLGGWGRGLRRGVASWFNGKTADDLAYQLVKYQQRDGWSARDLLRLSHADPARALGATTTVDKKTGRIRRTASPTHDALYAWVTSGFDDADTVEKAAALPPMIGAFEEVKVATELGRVTALVSQYKLPREAIPTQWLTKPEVWEAMMPHLGLTALVRNLATMTRVGVIAPFSTHLVGICARLQDAAALKKGRVHPIQMLSALRTYSRGHGERGGNTWTPIQPVVDALDAGFYASFGSIEPTGKATLLALDVSGSMGMGEIAGVPGLTPREAAAALAMVTAAIEPRYHCIGFSGGMVDLPITPRMRLNDVLKVVSGLPFDRTDCALPFLWAAKHRYQVDSFAVFTDNETWHGYVHPDVALRAYRQATGIAARSAVVGMTATEFTIANPDDAGMMDFVGFDASAPSIMSSFFRGTEPAPQA